MIVTVARVGGAGGDALTSRYTVTFDTLPGETFGPWGFREARDDLTVSALLSPVAARTLLLDACVAGSASRSTEDAS